jgi:glucose-1-phosphate cytidylyltransferase
LKVVILAGGLGTRLAEETEVKPKPMVEVGGQPILHHIMKHYAHYGFKDFYIALGYRGEVIKRYFFDYYNLHGDMQIDLAKGIVQKYEPHAEDWQVHLIDTGALSNTGGRVRRLQSWLANETFMVTYGDGVSNINLQELLAFHRQNGRIVTVSAVRPPARFGGLVFNGPLVSEFTEKPQAGEGWINGGFLVCEPSIFDYIEDDKTTLEADVLEKLANEQQLAAYQHYDFWQCMDTLRDKRLLEKLWQEGQAPWKIWPN